MKDRFKFMKINKILTGLFLGAVLGATLLVPFLAQAQPGTYGNVTGGPTTASDLVGLIKKITVWIAAIFFLVAVAFIIISAFDYLTAGGDEEKISSAKKKLVYAIVGIVIAALAFFIPRIVLDILDIGVLETPS